MISCKRVYSCFLMGIFILNASAVAAFDIAVDAHGGTMGMGLGGTVNVFKRLNIRAGINSSDFTIQDIEDDDGLEYEDPALDFDNQYVFLDFYPSKRGKFRFTVGTFANNNSMSFGARVVDANTLVGSTPAPIGTGVNAKISFASSAGYAGVGWGNAVSRGSPFGFGVDLGVMFQGEPQVDLTIMDPTCDPGPCTVSEADAEQERQELEEDVKDLDIWPVINFSFSYRF